MKMRNCDKLKVMSDINEIISFKYKGEPKFAYKQNILDENGKIVSWYYHDIFNIIRYVYYNAYTHTLHVPSNKLYSKVKLRNANLDPSICDMNYVGSLIGGSE